MWRQFEPNDKTPIWIVKASKIMIVDRNYVQIEMCFKKHNALQTSAILHFDWYHFAETSHVHVFSGCSQRYIYVSVRDVKMLV